jgi:indolepyruvate ferredoxin oxidoreductase alpha subunit
VLYDRTIFGAPYKVDMEKCTKCGVCFQLGCSAIGLMEGDVVIDELMCPGCTLCEQVCTFNAIERIPSN